LRRSILAVGACAIVFALGAGTASAIEIDGESTGTAGCGDAVQAACQTKTVASRPSVGIVDAEQPGTSQDGQPGGDGTAPAESKGGPLVPEARVIDKGDELGSPTRDAPPADVAVPNGDDQPSEGHSGDAAQPQNVVSVTPADQRSRLTEGGHPDGDGAAGHQDGQRSSSANGPGAFGPGKLNCSHTVTATQDQPKPTQLADQSSGGELLVRHADGQQNRQGRKRPKDRVPARPGDSRYGQQKDYGSQDGAVDSARHLKVGDSRGVAFVNVAARMKGRIEGKPPAGGNTLHRQIEDKAVIDHPTPWQPGRSETAVPGWSMALLGGLLLAAGLALRRFSS
jgi:hypothetical protein